MAVRLMKVILRCNTERSGDAWFGVRCYEGSGVESVTFYVCEKATYTLLVTIIAKARL